MTNNNIKRPYEDDQRNKNFGELLDYIRRMYKDIGSQLAFAQFIGVNKDTISNIKQGNTGVSDAVIAKVMEAFPDVFNLRWLQGKSAIMLQKDVSPEEQRSGGQIDNGSAINAALAAKDVTIAAKDEVIATKDKAIASLERELSTKNDMIAMLKERVDELKRPRNYLTDEDQDWPKPMGVAEP